MEKFDFGIPDYIMMGVMLMVCMAIGVYFAVTSSRKQSNSKIEYLLGGRRLGVLPVCLSMFATFHSAISLLGIPAELYSYGAMVVYNIVSAVLSHVILIWTIIPLIYPLKITSVYEYLQLRFKSRAIRLLGVILGMITSISYMTIALLSPALVLQTAVGLQLWVSIILVGSIGTVYTTIGGMKSVIWTDAFQTFVMLIGIIFVLVKGTVEVGGPSLTWEVAEQSGRLIFDDISPDPRVRHTVWGLCFAVIIYWFTFQLSQSSIQRLCSTKSIKDAKIVNMLTIPIVVFYNVVLMCTGLLMVVRFIMDKCDPYAAGIVSNTNQLMPFYVMHTLSFLPGLPGLYISTIFSGSLSTLSSGINSLAANTVEDLLPSFLKGRSDSYVTAVTRACVAFYGAVIIVLAYMAKGVSGPVTQV